MTQYSEAFRSRMVERLVGPSAMSANALSKEVGISQPALSRWLHAARSVDGMGESKKRKPARSGAEKLRLVLEASRLSGSELGAFLRREGLHEADLAAWRAAAEAGLTTTRRSDPAMVEERKRVAALERELRRKDAALAETAALLVLKKKVQAIWGDADDATDPRGGR